MPFRVLFLVEVIKPFPLNPNSEILSALELLCAFRVVFLQEVTLLVILLKGIMVLAIYLKLKSQLIDFSYQITNN